MVEGTPLLRAHTGNGIEGSNPFVSANHHSQNRHFTQHNQSFTAIFATLPPRKPLVLLHFVLHNPLHGGVSEGKTMNVTKRGSTYHLRKRVPGRYKLVEPRAVVWISLHTDSESVARQKAPMAWGHLIEAWEAKLAGDGDDAERRFEAAKELAAIRGFRYLPASRVADLDREELLRRLELVSRTGEPDKVEAAAVLGGASAPQITVTGALDSYWKLTRDQTLGKSDDQLRRWRNPRMKAVRNFVEVIGDKPLASVARDDMLAFRDWWTDKLETDGLTANSANKDIIHLGDVLRTVVDRKRLGLVLPFGGLSFKEGEAKTRPPFSVEWIKTKLLAKGALAGMNEEARAIMLAMVNTGARPSELAALTGPCIRLGGKVPHISIEPVDRQLKTPRAKRIIPLAGVSLAALRGFPEGFPRYRAEPATLSGTVNSFLAENGLKESPSHTLYSLRHSFEDRMLAKGVDERIRRDLMGHRLDREQYGKGAELAHLGKVIQTVAL